MKRAALAVILVAASSGGASAGTYLGLGIGTGPAFGGEFSGDLEMHAVGRSGKLLAGTRLGQFSIEGSVGQSDAVLTNEDPLELWQAAIAGKLSVKLGDGFEAFGKLGLQRTWLSHPNPDLDRSGNGYLLGAGAEYRFNLGVTAASLFVEYQYTDATLEDDFARTSDVSMRTWTLGLTIGI